MSESSSSQSFKLEGVTPPSEGKVTDLHSITPVTNDIDLWEVQRKYVTQAEAVDI